ncbi:hypothetical protein CRG98_027759 [Punica granatum]|uniref:Uncharacterized protein n=1 Tax=Punica granatum TaxID=22663 RepID=A0A2I0J6H3_PUNGR|nr:hypothetical protein CRG98_027759 [Punica granatum]
MALKERRIKDCTWNGNKTLDGFKHGRPMGGFPASFEVASYYKSDYNNHQNVWRTIAAFFSWPRYCLTFIQPSCPPTYSSPRKPSRRLVLRTSGTKELCTRSMRTAGGSATSLSWDCALAHLTF